MNSLQDLEEYMIEISKLPVNSETITDLENFIRFSPEKFADKINLERKLVTTKVDTYKKEIHRKIIIYKKVEKLKLKPVETFLFSFNGEKYKTKLCFTKEYVELKSVKFYPTIRYNYCSDLKETPNTIVLFAEYHKIYITEQEFNKNFFDFREYNINSLLNLDL